MMDVIVIVLLIVRCADVQQKVFSRWINWRLRHIVIEQPDSLVDQLRDGILLSKILSAVTQGVFQPVSICLFVCLSVSLSLFVSSCTTYYLSSSETARCIERLHLRIVR